MRQAGRRSAPERPARRPPGRPYGRSCIRYDHIPGGRRHSRLVGRGSGGGGWRGRVGGAALVIDLRCRRHGLGGWLGGGGRFRRGGRRRIPGCRRGLDRRGGWRCRRGLRGRGRGRQRHAGRRRSCAGQHAARNLDGGGRSIDRQQLAVPVRHLHLLNAELRRSGRAAPPQPHDEQDAVAGGGGRRIQLRDHVPDGLGGRNRPYWRLRSRAGGINPAPPARRRPSRRRRPLPAGPDRARPARRCRRRRWRSPAARQW